MAEAYATFAARGEHCNAIAITSVVDNTGRRLKVPQADCEQVLDKDIADGVNALLQGVMTAGTGRRAAISRRVGRQDRDARTSASHVWFIGYVPQLATAVWVGKPVARRQAGYQLLQPDDRRALLRQRLRWLSPGPDLAADDDRGVAGMPVKGFVRPPFKIMRGDAIRVPSVTGMSVDGARSRLQQAGFSVRVAGRRVYSLSASEGRVAYSSPGGGSSAYQGQVVTLFDQQGPAADPATR